MQKKYRSPLAIIGEEKMMLDKIWGGTGRSYRSTHRDLSNIWCWISVIEGPEKGLEKAFSTKLIGFSPELNTKNINTLEPYLRLTTHDS